MTCVSLGSGPSQAPAIAEARTKTAMLAMTLATTRQRVAGVPAPLVKLASQFNLKQQAGQAMIGGKQ
jgi:hypothetical protein